MGAPDIAWYAKVPQAKTRASENSLARSIKNPFNVGLSVASRIRLALRREAASRTASDLTMLCQLGRCCVGTLARNKPQKARPAATVADDREVDWVSPEIRIATRYGSAKITGNA